MIPADIFDYHTKVHIWKAQIRQKKPVQTNNNNNGIMEKGHKYDKISMEIHDMNMLVAFKWYNSQFDTLRMAKICFICRLKNELFT